MKKNLISIIILALLIVNIVLTSIMMFSVTSASRKTAALVDNIASVLSLELAGGTGGEASAGSVPIEDIEVYSLSEEMTIPLKVGDDGEAHYCLVSISFSINTKADDYKKYGSDLSGQESLIKGEINRIFGQYTIEEARASETQIQDEILASVQKLYDSTFIFNVTFSDILYQ